MTLMQRIFADQIRADPFNPCHPCAISISEFEYTVREAAQMQNTKKIESKKKQDIKMYVLLFTLWKRNYFFT
jgi:hypothetical protein